MPYIKQSSRPKFETVIEGMINTILSANVPRTNKVEYFGFFVRTLAFRYVQIPDNNLTAFNAYLFPEATRKHLNELAGKAATLVGAGDPLEAAGELNYAITSVLWALVDEQELSGYGSRAFLSGCIHKAIGDLANVANWQPVEQKDRVMATRRLITALGVLNDVLDETYRRKTSEYEDAKITENGDI